VGTWLDGRVIARTRGFRILVVVVIAIDVASAIYELARGQVLNGTLRLVLGAVVGGLLVRHWLRYRDDD
jgi:hypothetical protein